MKSVVVKRILSTVKSTDSYIDRDYNMNLYRGCTHGCIYCDSRSACYHIDDFDEVKVKANALDILERELKSKRKCGIIATGSMSDPYNPFEKKQCVTREALKLIDKYGFGVSITTKSSLISRDTDLFKSISSHSPVDIRLTITTPYDELASKIEPLAPHSSQRFSALERLSSSGAYTGIFITPVLPFITDKTEDILKLVDLGHECGVRNIVCIPGMTLRDGNREYYYEVLDSVFPGIKEKYISTFRNRYICASDNANEINSEFAKRCEEHGILYKFKEINSEIRSLFKVKQLELF